MSGFQNERYSVDQLVRYITEKILKKITEEAKEVTNTEKTKCIDIYFRDFFPKNYNTEDIDFDICEEIMEKMNAIMMDYFMFFSAIKTGRVENVKFFAVPYMEDEYDINPEIWTFHIKQGYEKELREIKKELRRLEIIR